MLTTLIDNAASSTYLYLNNKYLLTLVKPSRSVATSEASCEAFSEASSNDLLDASLVATELEDLDRVRRNLLF